MSEVMVQKEILETLTGIKEEVSHLKEDIHIMIELMEDVRLTEEEKKLVNQTIAKVKSKDHSGLISHASLKKELGL